MFLPLSKINEKRPKRGTLLYFIHIKKLYGLSKKEKKERGLKSWFYTSKREESL